MGIPEKKVEIVIFDYFFHFQRIKASLTYFYIQIKYLFSEKALKILIISGWHPYMNWAKWPSPLPGNIKLPLQPQTKS